VSRNNVHGFSDPLWIDIALFIKNNGKDSLVGPTFPVLPVSRLD